MPEPGRIHLHSVILCEDIREEARGRFSFMGVFRPTVWKIPTFPRRFYMGAALRFIAEQPGPVAIHVILEGDPLETPLVAEGGINVKYLDPESKFEVDQSVVGNLILKI